MTSLDKTAVISSLTFSLDFQFLIFSLSEFLHAYDSTYSTSSLLACFNTVSSSMVFALYSNSNSLRQARAAARVHCSFPRLRWVR